MSQPFSIIIIGGGLAGLTNALHLSIKGLKVLVIERHSYPTHKVCGEYISNEVLPYLNALGFDPFDFGAQPISQLRLSTIRGRSVQVRLPYGGFGISRYRIDWELAKLALEQGVQIVQDTAQDITFDNNQFEVTTNQNTKYHSRLVIGAQGKRSNLDVILNRDFIKRPSPNVAIKAHYTGHIKENEVGLHNFNGGYCGISMVENNRINICYIADLKTFKAYKNIDEFQREVLSNNKFLKQAFIQSTPVFNKPLTISQVSFTSKRPVVNHVLMSGDSAGMIHPLAGNGMSMAIRSAQMLSLLILKFTSGEIESRSVLEQSYQSAWNKEFSSRLKWGQWIAWLFRMDIISEFMIILLRMFPYILPYIIRKTHGKPMKPNL